VRKIKKIQRAAGSTDIIGLKVRHVVTRDCTNGVAIGKDQGITLPRMGGTDANIICIAGGNLPPRRHGHRLFAIKKLLEIVNFVNVQRHIQVGAIALRGKRGGGGGGGGTSQFENAGPGCVRVHNRKLTIMQLFKSFSRPLNALKKLTSTSTAATAS
jgi:hypothetical protein